VSRTFVGFGFGAIQAGLFLPEVQNSENFDRVVVSEIDTSLVNAVRASEGQYLCNIAESDQVRKIQVKGIEIYNPLVEEDRISLIEAIGQAGELCTALPSFHLYDQEPAPVAQLLAEGLKQKRRGFSRPPAVVYAAENDARAAKRLEAACLGYAPDGFANRVVFSETVIGKMCSIVTDQDRIQKENLNPINDECPRAILVEAFNDVFIDQSTPPGFLRGLDQFHPKSDLLPFAMAKFLGQNATHATLGYLAEEAGLEFMSDLREHPQLIERGLQAYIEEVGKGLCHEYGSRGELLFTEHGFAENATLAVKRMVNPLLADPVARVTRDPVRKLGWEDRLIGAIRMAQKAGVKPVVLLEAARLALKKACHENHWDDPAWALQEIWSGVSVLEQRKLSDLIL